MTDYAKLAVKRDNEFSNTMGDQCEYSSTLRDSGIELDLDLSDDQRDYNKLNKAAQRQKSDRNIVVVTSNIKTILSTQTFMTTRPRESAVNQSTLCNSGSVTRRDHDSNQCGTETASTEIDTKPVFVSKRTNKTCLMPYRYLMPSRVSTAKTVDDLFIPDNEDRKYERARYYLQPLLVPRVYHNDDDAYSVVSRSGNIRQCRINVNKALVVGLKSNITVSVPMMELRRQAAGDVVSRLDMISFGFTMSPDEHPSSEVSSNVTGTRDGYDVLFRFAFTPEAPGIHTLSIANHGSTLHYRFVFHAVANDPVLTFNDGGSWPVALAVDDSKTKRDQCIVYVAYRKHISEFLADGRYIKQLTTLKDGFYSQLAVAPPNNILAASVDGWRDTGSDVLRNHRLHLYHALSGRKLYQVAGDLPSSLSYDRSLSISSLDHDHILLALGNKLCRMNVRRRDVETRVNVKRAVSISRVCYHDNKFYVADAASGQVQIYHSISGQLLSTIPIQTGDDRAPFDLKALVVDKLGNIILSHCGTGVISIYNESGQILKNISSEWEPVRWPLDLAVESDGDAYLYVVDHGNICIKKFRYL